MRLSSLMILFVITTIIGVVAITPALSYADHHMIMSPKKQMQNGVAATDVVCKPGLSLMIRTSGDAICVMSTSVEKLTGLGFATLEKTATTIPDIVSDIKDDQMAASVNSQDIIHDESIHEDFPTITTVSVSRSNFKDDTSYLLEYEITAGNKNLEQVVVSIYSDIEGFQTVVPSLIPNETGSHHVIVHANDPSTINAHIQSYN